MDMQTYDTIKKTLNQFREIINNSDKEYYLERIIYPDGIKYIKKEYIK